jgi:hypothetical protein
MADLTGAAGAVGAVQGKLQDIRVANDDPSSGDAKELIPAGTPRERPEERSACSSPTSPSVAHPIIRENAPLTPRRYIKALQSMLKLIAKHQGLFNGAVKEAQQVGICGGSGAEAAGAAEKRRRPRTRCGADARRGAATPSRCCTGGGRQQAALAAGP